MKRLSRVVLFIWSALLIMGGLTACGIKAQLKRADKKFAIGEYYDAADTYKQIYPRISAKKDKKTKGYVAFRQGECYRILNISRAESAYKNALRYKYQLQDSTLYLRLAQVQAYLGKYKDAEKNFALYLNLDSANYIAQAGLYSCQQVSGWKKIPSRYRVSLSKEFNAKKSSNFAPSFIGSDGDAILFTSNRQSKKKGKKNLLHPSPVTGAYTFNIYTARKDANGQWGEILLPEGIYEDGAVAQSENENENDTTNSSTKASPAEMGVACTTSDGKTMFFTYSKPINGQDLGAKIYQSDRVGGEWGEPKEVKLFLDSSITVGHPSINASGDTLYFASDAPGGHGGKDIWMAELIDGHWINVQNLGDEINTSGDEMYPYIRSNGVLYYATNGHPGYGGLDIYKAIPIGRDTAGLYLWDQYNLGIPFNSQGDDFGITFAGNTENGYFSSNRGQKKGLDQIYEFILPEMILAVEGTIRDRAGDPISNATLRLVGNDGTNQKLQARRDGTYYLRLNKGTKYAMLASARGYLNERYTFSTFDLTDSHTYEQDFSLALVSKPITMNNIFYEFGKWELTPESEEGMQSLVKLLNDNPNITIELSAHTDMKGDSLYNLNLSEKRAQSCVNYLIAHGIERERLTPVGYGEQKPVVADQALHKRYPFISVDQVLTPEYILTLNEEQQEICNTLNRRTEFKVLKTTYKLY